MAFLRHISLYILAMLTLFPLATLATEYTRFEDLPQCGQVCLQKSISYAFVKADCGTSLACACKSGKYSEYILWCLRNNKPCSEEPTLMDVLRYQAAYYCNVTSDQRVRYTVEVGGAKKTLTLEGNEVQSTSHTTESSSHTTTQSTYHTAASSSRPTPGITIVTAQPRTSEDASASAPTVASETSTAVKSVPETTSTSDAAKSDTGTSTTLSDPSSSSSKSTSASSTSSSSSPDHPSSTTSLTESIPPGVTVVDASTTVMGHTVTVKATTLATATVNSGVGAGRYLDAGTRSSGTLALGLLLTQLLIIGSRIDFGY
ncbi:uncharacterized protein A1O9_11978 [Exophiala aquamarina CBS 119918]|uniref:Extracellular membrane protein CFEM domain-containing protein n=1 Tax=Exophiala aquamarina CBS 119918 TaxID=1182545 RepID=A0A072NY69_9EURO|nr:uncharacterized protein A1O9_11978 [Exophiala aquamarina CBS 119918]KEF51988.1 hypothetical protein A1O9_11978 [Exophiala aquamarina CBS 119918]